MLHVIEADRSMSSLKDTGASPGTSDTSDTSECPICREHAPTSQLSSSGNFAPNGVWMGPHCAACEREVSQQARQNQPPTILDSTHARQMATCVAGGLEYLAVRILVVLFVWCL